MINVTNMEIECWENTADTTDIKSIKEYTTNNCTSIKSIYTDEVDQFFENH